MCGICGFVLHKPDPATDYDGVLDRMTRVLAHRGPDGHGRALYRDASALAGLGHRRLSIIDLSDKASQPMDNENQSVSLVFNGEIYNYQKLSADLRARGHEFQSQSDTEAIVHLYEEKGRDLVKSLEGMFGLAVWDKKNQRLLLARDPLGIKPLFYMKQPDGFYFASEIKSLLFAPGFRREINKKALDEFVTFGYISGERTIFSGVKKLPPGHLLTYSKNRIAKKQYWAVQYLPKSTRSSRELARELEELVNQSVGRHLVSDVPVGAFLSGGVDSSVLVAAMSRQGMETPDTFSLGFDTGGEDELEYAALVARRFNTRHHVHKASPALAGILPRLLWHLDEPFFDNSILPVYLISQEASKRVKVVLSGDGGDELFGGYEWTSRNQYRHYFQALFPFSTSPLERRMAGVEVVQDYGAGYYWKARRFFGDLAGSMNRGFLRRTAVSAAFRQALYSPDLQSGLSDYDARQKREIILAKPRVEDDRERMLYADLSTYLPDDCLFKVDRMSMAHGLEVRVPLLDRKLVEFCARIPFEYKTRGFTTKYLLKKAFERHLPKKILKQRKQGFTVPVSAWLRGELGNTARTLLLGPRAIERGLFDKKFIQWMLEEHQSGRQQLGHRIWSLVVFETWARLYLDRKITSAPSMSLEEVAA